MSEGSAHSQHVLGHEEAIRQLTESFSTGRMHHAWLLTGIEGVGKATLALHMADHVLSGGKNKLGQFDPHNRTTKLVLGNAHPDMLVLKRATDEKTGALKSSILVDEALKIANFLHKTSTHGGWRLVLVDEAHTLNRSGQNAILKILEEPPARTLIIMTATTAGALLPTIRSRTRVLSLAPLDNAHMSDLLSALAPDLEAGDKHNLIRLSGGSIGFALKILRSEALPLYQEAVNLLTGTGSAETIRLHQLADQIGRKAESESFEVVTTLLTEHIRDAIRTSAIKGAGGPALERRLQLWDRLRATLDSAEHANLDRKLAFIKAISDIRGAIA